MDRLAELLKGEKETVSRWEEDIKTGDCKCNSLN